MAYKTCRKCGIPMAEYTVHLLDEVYDDCFYASVYNGHCCPLCRRLVANNNTGYKNGNYSKGTFSIGGSKTAA